MLLLLLLLDVDDPVSLQPQLLVEVLLLAVRWDGDGIIETLLRSRGVILYFRYPTLSTGDKLVVARDSG
jgi:hypothetical protein